MVIQYAGYEIPCTKAVKGANWVKAYNGDIIVLAADKLADPSSVVLTGGEWSAPEQTDAEKIAALDQENKLLSQQILALSDQNDFQEELIVELANIVYA